MCGSGYERQSIVHGALSRPVNAQLGCGVDIGQENCLYYYQEPDKIEHCIHALRLFVQTPLFCVREYAQFDSPSGPFVAPSVFVPIDGLPPPPFSIRYAADSSRPASCRSGSAFRSSLSQCLARPAAARTLRNYRVPFRTRRTLLRIEANYLSSDSDECVVANGPTSVVAWFRGGNGRVTAAACTKCPCVAGNKVDAAYAVKSLSNVVPPGMGHAVSVQRHHAHSQSL
ncbi:hypothetical protein ACJJTC_016624 [Scirpophaga incertulas]